MRIEERFKSGQSLKKLSTFGIGGEIRYYLRATEIKDVSEAIHWARLHNIPYFILGNGSNCLFDDQGFNGLVIHNKIDFCTLNDNTIFVGAGYRFSLLGIQSAKNGLSGLEFASGIPASVGGAIFMNAGANNGSTSQFLHEVIYLHETGVEEVFLRKNLEFGYRFSSFQSMKGSILAARFILEKNSAARKVQLSIIEYRTSTQPIKEKSAGCVFRNPLQRPSAGALIDQCQLKGFSIGGAKVSEIHANFIVNHAEATKKDVIQLIEHIQRKVYEKTGILLEPEIRLVPFE